MEMIAGVSYATACEGKNLREGMSFEFPSEDSKLCWKRAWKIFEKLGLSDKPPELEPAEERFTMSIDTYLRSVSHGPGKVLNASMPVTSQSSNELEVAPVVQGSIRVEMDLSLIHI